MSKWRIEFEKAAGRSCFAATDDDEFDIRWCQFKNDEKDINECVCRGLGNPGCPAKKVEEKK